MSDPIRIALVAEGPTDRIVLEAAIRRLLGDTPFKIQQLQPEESLGFLSPGCGLGWGGVYRWCRKAVERSGGEIENDILFRTYRILIVHLDADVGEEEYSNAGIDDMENDLPCAEPCPPASDTTNRLRSTLLRWLGRATTPANTVLCTPSRNTESWVLCALYPGDAVVTSGTLECFESPETRLQAKPLRGRIISGGKKHLASYRARQDEICTAWPTVREICSEADRFSIEFLAVL